MIHIDFFMLKCSPEAEVHPISSSQNCIHIVLASSMEGAGGSSKTPLVWSPLPS